MKHKIRGDTTVIDFAAHFYPEEIQKYRDTSRTGGSSGDDYAGIDRRRDPETRIAELHEANVDAMVASTTSFMSAEDPDIVAEANDVLIEYVQENEEFYGLAALPTGAGGEAAAEELERAVEMGFNGGAVRTESKNGIALPDEEMEPVFEVAEKTGAPIFVHVPTMPYTDFRANAIFGRERGLQESIAETIHTGVYDRHPDLKLIWHHMGGNIAAMLGRIHLHTDPGRWPLQEDLKSFEEFKQQLEEHVYIDTSGFFGHTGPIRIALEEFPSTQILFGTDSPGEPRNAGELSRMADAILESGTYTDAKRILGQNALDVMVNTD